jgi:LmbE family N-acetylglucosaminyl deacetylase
MLRLIPDPPQGLHLACLGAHPDDIEIGAGGAVLQLAGAGRLDAVTWVVFSGTPDRVREGKAAAEAFLDGVPTRTITFHDFRDGYFPSCYGDIKDVFEALKSEIRAPDLILGPRIDDAHQDHRLVAELARSTFRDHLILEYEIPKYDGDLSTPNVYVSLEPADLERKIDLIVGSFPSQVDRAWFDPESFRGLARIRGIEAGGGARYAEGFHASKTRLAFGSRGSTGPHVLTGRQAHPSGTTRG